MKKKLLYLLLLACIFDGLYAESSLRFYGINSYINLGNQLGLSKFTLEAWIKVQGKGTTATSGNGGVNAVPIICKGCGEEDANSKDCNYFFGYDPSTMRLVADFEEGSTGANPGLNHPVYGSKSLKYNTWHHVAVAYDGRKWYLYLNGELDTTKFINQPVQNYSIQYASIGSALTSTASPTGFFNGIIDDVRIWNSARTKDEIKQFINRDVTGNEEGLVSCWNLNEGTGSIVNGLGLNASIGVIVSDNFTWLPENAPYNLPFSPAGKYSSMIFRAGIIADPQYKDANSTDRYYRESLAKLATAIDTFNVNQVDFIQTLGDLIDEDSISYDPVLNIYKNLNKNIPAYHLLGNHDFSVQQQFKSRITTKLGMPGNYYSYIFRGYRFIVLDAADIAAYTDDISGQNPGNDKTERDSLFRLDEVTNKTDYSGALGRNQLKWLRSELNSARINNEKVVVFSHMPVLPKPNVHNLWNDFQVVEILTEYKNVCSYMNGHNHYGGYELFNGIHFVSIFAMVQGQSNSFAIVDFYDNKMIIRGFGNQEDRILEFANDAPYDIEMSNNNVYVNTRKGDFIGVLNVKDPNEFDNHNFFFSSGTGDDDNQLFIIRKDSLFLNVNLNREMKSQFTIRLKALDSRNDSVVKVMMLNFEKNQQTGLSDNLNEAYRNSFNKEISVFSDQDKGIVSVKTTLNDINTLSVYNSAGNKVYFSKKPENKYPIEIDLKQMPSDIYILNLRTTNKDYSNKFIHKRAL